MGIISNSRRYPELSFPFFKEYVQSNRSLFRGIPITVINHLPCIIKRRYFNQLRKGLKILAPSLRSYILRVGSPSHGTCRQHQKEQAEAEGEGSSHIFK